MVNEQMPDLQEKARESYAQLRTVPLSELVTNFQNNPSIHYLERGSSGLVFRDAQQVIKIGFGYGFSHEQSISVAQKVHKEKQRQKQLTKKLEIDLIHTATFQKQALGHLVGSQLVPSMIDPPNFLLVHDTQVCGIAFPYYQGEFIPLKDPRFNLKPRELELLEANGVRVDDFSHRNNGVILDNGQKKIIDLSYARSKLG